MAFTGCNRNGHRLLMAFLLGKDEGVWLELRGSSVYTMGGCFDRASALGLSADRVELALGLRER